MDLLLLSKSSMPIIKYVAQLLGWLMNGIYEVLNKIGIPNIGLAIILYTLIVYICMTPIQISQQKSSKMLAVINPELKEIQKKYQGRRDQASQLKMQEETQEVYHKYGYNPMGSCLPLLIQLPLLFALYQVIYHIPGYISKVYQIFEGLADKIIATTGSCDVITQFITDNSVRSTAIKGAETFTTTNVVDFLYLLKPSQWTKLANLSEFSGIKSAIMQVQQQSNDINSFLGIDISQTPWDCIKEGITTGTFILVILAILVPVLAWFTQWLNYKLMPQQVAAGSDNMNSMQSVNMIMPLFSAVMCLSLSFGIGIYWISGATIRCIQQITINRRIMKMDVQEMIAKNVAKQKKKEDKKKEISTGGLITQQAKTNVRKLKSSDSPLKGEIDSEQFYKNAENASPDSITARANMVRRFDEANAQKLAEKSAASKSSSKKKKKKKSQSSAKSAAETVNNKTEEISEESKNLTETVEQAENAVITAETAEQAEIAITAETAEQAEAAIMAETAEQAEIAEKAETAVTAENNDH